VPDFEGEGEGGFVSTMNVNLQRQNPQRQFLDTGKNTSKLL